MRINFSNPFNGRKWLSLLKESTDFGLSFSENISLSEKYLGFTFSTNKYGLRGPDDESAPLVICGTSFAMGLSVNDGDNWYDLLSNNCQFNIGFPVATRCHNRRLDLLYNGGFNRLFFIYHPNNWMISHNFFLAEEGEKKIFEHMKWKTSLIDTFKIFPKWIIKSVIKRYKGIFQVHNYKGVNYHINSRYSIINLEKKKKFVEYEMKEVNKLFSRFNEVVIIRVPVKEQVVEHTLSDDLNLKRLVRNYEDNYYLFKQNINHNNFRILDFSDKFELDDYHAFDTHWNKKGNYKFHELVKSFF
ncbi:hypothetical protein [Joostella sp. CR20]|uniref:hypothetical protein n=1 Tax=Joostella sp. CR20 TaxID=2804312 RepID=UPI00313BD74C